MSESAADRRDFSHSNEFAMLVTNEFTVQPMPPSLHLLNDGDGSQRDEAVWHGAITLDEYIARATIHQELWKTTHRIARISDALRETVAGISTPLSLLVLTEDWCGDAIHTLPFVARLVDANSRIDMRVVSRDANAAIMNAHLSGVSRSIPVVIAYNESGRERGWWGPRPTALQHWVKNEGLSMEKDDRYKAIRTWYARDRGETTASEVLQLLVHAAQ